MNKALFLGFYCQEKIFFKTDSTYPSVAHQINIRQELYLMSYEACGLNLSIHKEKNYEGLI